MAHRTSGLQLRHQEKLRAIIYVQAFLLHLISFDSNKGVFFFFRFSMCFLSLIAFDWQPFQTESNYFVLINSLHGSDVTHGVFTLCVYMCAANRQRVKCRPMRSFPQRLRANSFRRGIHSAPSLDHPPSPS